MTDSQNQNTITIMADGNSYQTEPGESILNALERHGFHIPTLCYEEGLPIIGACRLCVVEISGARKLHPACSTPVADGMNIFTESEQVVEARREILKLLLANHDLRCLTCERNADCRLQDYCYRYKVEDTPYVGDTKNYPIDRSNPFFFRDYGKCIMCGKCVSICAEINGAYVYDFMDRGFDSKVTSAFDDELQNTTCTFCGMCVNVCPVGALVERSVEWRSRPWEVDKVLTTCPYCGVGCQMYLKVQDGEIVGVSRKKDSFTKGHLCGKGQFGWDFVHSKDRLTKPMIRKDGQLTEVSWDVAMEYISENLSRLYNESGSDAIAGLSSAKVTNEENYLFQKLLRTAFKTNHIDHCARLCHSSTVWGLATSFGSGAMTNSINELLETDCIVVIGSNTTEAHPVTGYRIKQANKMGKNLIVIDPRKIELTNYADEWLKLRPATNVALLNGIARVIYKEGLWDQEFVEARSEGFQDWIESIEGYTPERVQEITGVPKDKLIRTARLIGNSNKVTFVYAMGVTQYTQGTQNVLSIANLAILTGNVGRRGTGVNPLRGQNNVQGACDMGALPNYFPSYQPIEDPVARDKFKKVWGTVPEPKPGLTVTEIIEKAGTGDIRGLYIMGENPAVSDPDADEVERSLEETELLIVQDIFMTETAKLADVVLPATSFAETEGTFTNTERRVQRVRKAVEPPGQAKTDREILTLLANRLELNWNYNNDEEVMDEINKLAPFYGGITFARLENEGLQWPCYHTSHPGTEFLHKDQFSRGKGKFHPVKYIPPSEEPSKKYPLILNTGRWLYHFHTGTMSLRSQRLKWLRDEELAMVNPQVANELDIEDGDIVKIASRRGKVKSKVQVTDHVPQDMVFMTFHFPETLTNRLTTKAKDPICKIPELKSSAVRIEKE
ncbi:formate dehydrogenase subunit alpha [Natranaerobius thermophilus]|nr:formate dehydrogenase subunit alpha [Natranaerobius thermophilus]